MRREWIYDSEGEKTDFYYIKHPEFPDCSSKKIRCNIWGVAVDIVGRPIAKSDFEKYNGPIPKNFKTKTMILTEKYLPIDKT